MLIDFQYLTNTKRLVISYVDNSGDIKLKYYEWDDPQKFVICSDDDPKKHETYKSWDGKSVKLESVSMPDRYTVYEFLDSLPENEKNEIFEYHTPKIYFVDIETEILDGFPDAETAPTKVLSISIVYDDKIILLGLKDMPEDMQSRIKNKTNEYFKKFNSDYKFKYIKYDDEFDMMYNFFYKMIPKKFNKMSIQEQEVFLVNKLKELYQKEKIYRKALAQVRSNVKVEIKEIDRPDEAILKSEN